MVAGDGTFQFANVAPGRYNLQVRPQGHAERRPASLPAMNVTVGNDDHRQRDRHDLAPDAIARGVVMTDDGSAPSFRPDQVSDLSVSRSSRVRR